MKLSLNWLGDYLKWKDSDPQIIAAKITAHVAEVDEVEIQGSLLNNCCVGKVLSMTKHPNADRLTLCDVKTDKGTKRVVCGGTNLREGMRVAFAHVGARVCWHGTEMMTLEPVKIRGEASEGMICAGEELGLDDLFPATGEHEIVDLGDSDDGVGKDLRSYLGLDDVVLHIDNHAITHRPDLFSHVGFARECVAIGIATWKKEFSEPTISFPSDSLPVKCNLKIKNLVPRYCSCTLKVDDIGETPEWMKKRLLAVGYRPLNLPVDITNYVSAEVGMPLHSFDLDDISGDIEFRTSKKGETITTLDKKERALPEGAIVLSDKEGIFDLMGIMGGLRSSTKESTRTIYLHSAVVDPITIRRTILATGHRTDAATIYEKNIPLVSARVGFLRALELFLELAPGATVTSQMESYGEEPTLPAINLSLERMNLLLGTDIDAKRVMTILSDLGCDVAASGDELSVTPPLHRAGDLRAEHDLIEEVGRVYGFDAIENRMPEAPVRIPKRDFRVQTLRRSLVRDGCFETVPLSLVGPSIISRAGFDVNQCYTIENALGEELSLLAPSTLPRLLEQAPMQLKQAEADVCTFSVANVFAKKTEEHRELCLLYAAAQESTLMTEPFLQAKMLINVALENVGYTAVFKDAKPTLAAMHPGRSADVAIDDVVVGQLFEVHPAMRAAFDLPHRAAACILNLTKLLAIPAHTMVAEHLSQFPAVEYDITVTLNHSKSVDQLLQKIRESSKLLESVSVADLYSGKPLTDGAYNLTLRCRYRAADRTLTDEEAKKEYALAEKVCHDF